MHQSFKKILSLALFALAFLTLAQVSHLPHAYSESKNQFQDSIFVYAIDGDTIIVKINGRKQHVRLIGIDTPESRANDKAMRDAIHTKKDVKTINKLGRTAAQYTRSLLQQGDHLQLEYDVERHDKYDRLLAYVYLPDNSMLNEKIILNGYAKLMTIPPNVKYSKRFESAFKRARSQGLGLWGTQN